MVARSRASCLPKTELQNFTEMDRVVRHYEAVDFLDIKMSQVMHTTESFVILNILFFIKIDKRISHLHWSFLSGVNEKGQIQCFLMSDSK